MAAEEVLGRAFTWGFGLVRNDTTDKVRVGRFEGRHELVQLFLLGGGRVW